MIAFFLLLGLCFTVVIAAEFNETISTSTGISRSTVHSRMQTWVDAAVPYSQSAYYEGYRTDCSGYVSMGWQLGSSQTTSTLYPSYCSKITQSDLAMGDAMLLVGTHVIMFDKWINSDSFYAYQEPSTGKTAQYYTTSYNKLVGEGYFACRYKSISN
jgi:hypothetical protein